MTGALAVVMGEMDVLRTLGLAGIRCAVVAKPSEPTRWSRFTAEVVEWADPWSEPDEAVRRLVEFGRRQVVKPVLYYDGDWDLLLVSRRREELRRAFRFVVAERELVEDLVDKDRFRDLSLRFGLPVPPSAVLREPDAGTLAFPLLLKPLTRQHATWRPVARAKAARVRSADELRAIWPRIVGTGVEVLAQEIVEGPESAIESYHVYVPDDGGIAAEFTGRKLRTHPREFGYSTAVVITRADDVMWLGRDIVERIGLTGVAKLDFKRAADGRLHLLEINPRFNLWHHPGALAGVNIPAAVHADLTGGPSRVLGSARPGVRWCSVRDLQAARAEGMPLHTWARFFARCEARSKVAFDDPMPLVRAVLARLR